jgi:hypothetical protein
MRIPLTLYLDVDGVIVGRNHSGKMVLIPDIEKILLYTRKNFRCFWLTTHGRHNTEDVLRYLTPYSEHIDLSLFDHIKTVRWNTLKTEAIDFSRPFIWIDDQPLRAEIDILKQNRCLGFWLYVDTYRNIRDLTAEKIEAKKREILRKVPGGG